MAIDHYVWIWLRGQTVPTLCGLLRWDGQAGKFAYVKSYLGRQGAISIHPDWPLSQDLGHWNFPSEDDALPGAIADVAPGRWGEYVIEKARGGTRPTALEFLLAGGDDRTGALGFSASVKESPEEGELAPTLEKIEAYVARLDEGFPAGKSIALLFKHGPSLGGRRPKATVAFEGALWIAKFVSVKDFDLNQPRLEAFGLILARKIGIEVPDYRLVEVGSKPVLLVRRFDRAESLRRTHVLSARSLLNLSERQMTGPAASYPAMAKILRRLGEPADVAHRWFDRMIYNIAIGNTDDHALNHLFEWDGQRLTMMPAFDVEPQLQDPEDRHHEMVIGAESRVGSLKNAIAAAADFGLSTGRAQERADELVQAVWAHWEDAAQAAGIVDRDLLQKLRSSIPKEQP